MAKIVVFGDIDIASLYLSIDGCKEITVKGKHPISFPLTAGLHEIAATTVSKIERVTQGWGGGGFLSAANAALQSATNTTVGGVLDFKEDDVLLIEVEQKGFKTKVYNKMLSAEEAKQFVEVNSAVPYKKKKSRGIKILLAMLAGILGLFLLLFLWVFMAEMPTVH
jgi:hypothetical protein